MSFYSLSANFIGSVSTRKGSGREVAKEAMARILSERRRMRVTSVQPVLVEVTCSGVTTHVIEKAHSLNTSIPPIHFSIKNVTYSAVQGSRSVAYIVRDDHQQDKFTCYVYETEEQVDFVLDIFQKAFDTYKKSKLALINSKS
ncbi:hypothetical protein LOD99_564 [Oopsacas minuta]|uniref:PID domain-containing protein n=1 Tax=Oopsacas minuta TaxID=111878 RepID=A0AAV7K9Q2_9METZ|nr:hypothetical protein LOD99_564 [Oopsacas minuta]